MIGIFRRAALPALVASGLAGCGDTRGYEPVDIEAARREGIAKGRPNPLIDGIPKAPQGRPDPGRR